jgi:hypothetical protein
MYQLPIFLFSTSHNTLYSSGRMLAIIKSINQDMHQKLKKGIPAPGSSRVQGILSLINAPIPRQFFQNPVMRIIAPFLILNHSEQLFCD